MSRTLGWKSGPALPREWGLDGVGSHLRGERQLREPYLSLDVSPPHPISKVLLAVHSLAEVTGAAGREGQRADEGVAGDKGGAQQRLAALEHTLEPGQDRSWPVPPPTPHRTSI